MNNETINLFKEYKTINKQIKKLQTKSNNLKLKLNEIRFGYKIGDEIEYCGIKGKVCDFQLFWLEFCPYKKDGTLHKYVKDAYDIKAAFEL